MDKFIQMLAEKRSELDDAVAVHDQVMTEWLEIIKEHPVYRLLCKRERIVDELRDEVKGSESTIRELILSNHELTGEKQYPGAQVKLFKVRRYDDSDALEWCVQQKYTNALKLDRKQFEKLADVVQPPWVEFDTEPRVHIDRDLSQFLETGGVSSPEHSE